METTTGRANSKEFAHIAIRRDTIRVSVLRRKPTRLPEMETNVHILPFNVTWKTRQWRTRHDSNWVLQWWGILLQWIQHRLCWFGRWTGSISPVHLLCATSTHLGPVHSIRQVWKQDVRTPNMIRTMNQKLGMILTMYLIWLNPRSRWLAQWQDIGILILMTYQMRRAVLSLSDEQPNVE